LFQAVQKIRDIIEKANLSVISGRDLEQLAALKSGVGNYCA
jgi:hypothetical protein